MKLNFSGRTALITGGAGGIGLSIVKKLIKNKIKVIILDINTPSKKILLNKFVEFIKIDLSNYKNLQLCLTELKKKYKALKAENLSNNFIVSENIMLKSKIEDIVDISSEILAKVLVDKRITGITHEE